MRSSKIHADSEWQVVGFTISLLLHLVLFFVLDRAHITTPTTNETIDVSLEPPLAPPSPPKSSASNSIVSPSDTTSEKIPANAQRVSERNSEVTHEQVKRGEPGSVGSSPLTENGQPSKAPARPESHSPPPSPPEVKQQPQRKEPSTAKAATKDVKPLHHLDNLLLDDSTLSEKFARRSAEAREESSPPQASSARSATVQNYKAFSRPQGSGAMFASSGGIRDFLPNLPDGDITMLNAKAATYAGFVRRVGVQVFGQLQSKGWEQLSYAEIRQLTSETTIEAVLSREGKFLRASVLGNSGSPPFDLLVNHSVQAGARDPHPPEGAEAKDGLIHFIFKARSWSEFGASARNGAPVERRWLLLAIGLED